MGIRDTGTEQLIKDTAKRVFFSDGNINATMQDIADAAGITRTSVNYYFRSKDILFELVFREAMTDMGLRMDEVILSTLPFRQKVEKFIDLFYREFQEYPYKEAFMISEINSHGFTIPKKEKPTVMTKFLKEVEQEMEKGTIKKMKPMNFLLNMFSLMAYPLLTRPLFKLLFELSDNKYDKLLNERKEMIIGLLFN